MNYQWTLTNKSGTAMQVQTKNKNLIPWISWIKLQNNCFGW